MLRWTITASFTVLLWATVRAAPLPLPPPGPRVCVMPFPTAHGRSDADSFLLAEGAQRAITGISGVLAVERLAILDLLRRNRALDLVGPAQNEALLQVGQLAGASHVLLGSVNQAGGVARVSLRLVEVASRQVHALPPAHAPTDDLLGLLDEVFCTVQQHLPRAAFPVEPPPSDQPAVPPEPAPLGEQPLPDAQEASAACRLDESLAQTLPARRSYAQALLLSYQGRRQEALRVLNQTLEDDPSYREARALRDALYFSAAPNNEWVYRVVIESPPAGEAVSLVRRVVRVEQPANAPPRVVTEGHFPVALANGWGECEGTETAVLTLRDHWAYLQSEETVFRCPKLKAPHVVKRNYSDLPYVPLDPQAAALPAHDLTLVEIIKDVGRSEAHLRCEAVTLLPTPRVATPVGTLEGLTLRNRCERVGPLRLQPFNQARAEAYKQKEDAVARELEERAKRGGLVAVMRMAVPLLMREEIPQPGDLLMEQFGSLYTAGLNLRRTFVPAVGVVQYREELTNEGRKPGVVSSVTTLDGLTVASLSAGDAGANASTPLRRLGDTARAWRSRLGGRPGEIHGGVLVLLRPRFETLDLRFSGGVRLSAHILGDALAIGASRWLAQVLRVGAEVAVLGGLSPTSFDAQERFGADYNGTAWLDLKADLRGRLAGRGLLSVPQMLLGARGQVFQVKNMAADGAAPRGPQFNHTFNLWRLYFGPLLSASLHDRLGLELGYRISYLGGAFGLEDSVPRVSMFTHGLHMQLCGGTTADRSTTGLGACLHGFIDGPLFPSRDGAASFGVTAGGASFDLVFHLGTLQAGR